MHCKTFLAMRCIDHTYTVWWVWMKLIEKWRAQSTDSNSISFRAVSVLRTIMSSRNE